MIPIKINTLFEFIDFLDEKKETFILYNGNFDKAIAFNKEKLNFNPKNSFSDRIEYEKLDKLKNKEFDKVWRNVTILINKKATDLGIQKVYNAWYFGSEYELKNKATFEDLSIIKEHLDTYFAFRDVGRHYFNQIFFSDLDRFLIDIAEYFGNKYNDKFKDNPKKINDLAEAVEHLKKTGEITPPIPLDNVDINRQQSNIQAPPEPQQKPKKKKKDTLWFKVGLLFANGKMEKYYSDNGKAMSSKYTAGKIADEVNLPKGEKYILGTLQGYKSDKNIYNNRDKMISIIEHCENADIEVHKSFLEKLPPETI
ncbi:hypothetical protein [Mesonia sp.]|uniref:hypothetical protein n=1 Tax=Mesonia sp. TaxID=1960830 RepID=UPI003F9B11FE